MRINNPKLAVIYRSEFYDKVQLSHLTGILITGILIDFLILLGR